ncbi:colanic acid/amylovoran biosynthesis protein [Anseongella ginsenosidimutans]|uniref:Colanic acid/amylovoran biosynthesis protein n=1 Tax=Anseongella ginsenosidimutans TaxID=496056 RepID=A0A4R3KWD3_9SPHI|nr:polysaccharide pyruvyl transferase family protein [Anseongella ginsenosidimutans]QEC53358.1 polysaccharide pyruvyl transferase family protein [Anseongella ginsenosidimutans]TCS88241.1 colanic acid/amylovoran biosynthesis protein [Anseongella ginsenosidimutans]
MIIELRGVEFVNKGAELMLHAIMEQIADKVPDAIFVMDRGARSPVKKLKQHNIYVKLNGRRYSKLGQYLPKPLRRRMGYILDKEIGIVMDGSGFAFGDQWGAPYAERRLGSNIIKWKKQGKKIILLPQAFGPFKEPGLREIMNKILFHADLVFAREQQSYEYLRDVSPAAQFLLAPDFTNLIKGNLPTGFNPEKHRVAIIPNYKMIEQADDNNQNAYFDFLLTAAREVSALGLHPYFLIHEGNHDAEIAEKVNRELEKPLAIITNENPVMIKGMIASAYFIICSRFHGTVSALSQAVPCLVTSWSHKYEMLLSEYEYEEGLIRDLGDHTHTKKLIHKIADPDTNKAISQKLALSSNIQKERSLEMWEAVFKVINK